jgi:hypothetical protein
MKTQEEAKWEKTQSFVALFDVLGFKELIRNSEVTKVAATYNKMVVDFGRHEEVLNRALRSRVTSRCFSDTFLLYTIDTDEESFESLIIACFFLYLAAVVNRLPLRGAITVGSLLIADGMEIGQPIVEAHDNEQKQDWMGCWVADECFKHVSSTQRYLDCKWIVKYEIPFKDGEKVGEQYALNWVYLICFMHSYFAKSGDNQTLNRRHLSTLMKVFPRSPTIWGEKRKIDNTRKFLSFVSSSEFLAYYRSVPAPGTKDGDHR